MDETTQVRMYQGGYLRPLHENSFIVNMRSLELDFKKLFYKNRYNDDGKWYMILQMAQFGENIYAEIVEVKEKKTTE